MERQIPDLEFEICNLFGMLKQVQHDALKIGLHMLI